MSRLLATTLEKEIARLARTELHKALATLTAEVSALRKQLAAHERRLDRQPAASARTPAPSGATSAKDRLNPASIRSHRKRLGLSQVQLAKVTGVTPVAVYFWEAGRTVPQGSRREVLLELRKMSPRQAEERLATLGAGEGRKKPANGRKKAAAGRGRKSRTRKTARKASARKK